MGLLTQTDFQTGIYQVSSSDQSSAELTESIDRIEDEILTDLLGIELKNAYDVGIAVLPTPDQKWLDLRDGKEYEDTPSGITVEYKGFKDLLKPFTYSDFIKKMRTQNTAFGQSKIGARNSAKISKIEVLNESKEAYNLGLSQYAQAERFISENKDDYPNQVFKRLYSK